MSNPHVSTDTGTSNDVAPTHLERRAVADRAYEQGDYASAVTAYDHAARFDGISDDVHVKMLIRKARSLLQLHRFDEMHGALDEAWDIAHAESLIGLLDEVNDLKAQHASL